MSLTDNDRLFDITTRLALFVEGVKLGQLREFNAVLAAVELELARLFGRVQYKTLDGLSKNELNKLLLSLRKSQLQLYTAFTAKLIQQLQDFMQARLSLTAIAYASAKRTFDNNGEPVLFNEAGAIEYIEDESRKLPFAPLFGIGIVTGAVALWPRITNAPIPANGLYILPFIQAFSRSAQASVENTIRKAYANKQTVAATVAELTGRQGMAGTLAKVGMQANAVIETAIAHVDQISAQSVISAIFNHYVWLSVIDGATTQICRERDEQIYRYGFGPIPPAHYRCRSATCPLVSRFSDFKTPTLYAWLKRQPYPVQREFMGKAAADAMNEGLLTAKEFGKLQLGSALTIAQFKQKLGLVLT